MISMGEGGVACVAASASQNFVEHFNSFERNMNSALDAENSQQKKEGSGGEGRVEFDVATIDNVDRNGNCDVERRKRSSRWDVDEDSNGNGKIENSKVRENGGGGGLVSHGDEAKEGELRAAHESSGRDNYSKSKRGSEEMHLRSGYYDSHSCRNSIEKHSSVSKSHHGSKHSRNFEQSPFRSGNGRYPYRRSRSIDKGCSERGFKDRRGHYEARNRGFRKSCVEQYSCRYNGNMSYDNKRYHDDRNSYADNRRIYDDRINHDERSRHDDRTNHADRSRHDDRTNKEDRYRHNKNLDWRERSRSSYRQSHSSWDDGRQSHSSWEDRVLDERNGRYFNSGGSHGKSSNSTRVNPRSKNMETLSGMSPSGTPASEKADQKEGNGGHIGQQNASAETPKHEEEMCGGWFYIDHHGIEQGPKKLVDLKLLAEDGQLQSDHLVRRKGSHEWVTIENAASPMPFRNLSISKLFSESQIAQASETQSRKPGVVANISHNSQGMQKSDSTITTLVLQDDIQTTKLEEISKRVEQVLQGFALVPGWETEMILDGLYNANKPVNHVLEDDVTCEGSPGFLERTNMYCRLWLNAEFGSEFENEMNASKMDTAFEEAVEKDYDKYVPAATGIIYGGEGSSQFSGRWPSKGGDWKRSGEHIGSDKLSKRKRLVNDGVLLCDTWKSGVEDPRKSFRECCANTQQYQRLLLPPWAYHWPEENNDRVLRIDNAHEVCRLSSHGSVATVKSSITKVQVSAPSSQLSTPRKTSVCLLGHDELKTTKTSNGDFCKSLTANKLNQHVSSTAKVSNNGKAISYIQLEIKPLLKSNTTVFKYHGPSAWDTNADSQYMECNVVMAEQVPDPPLDLSVHDAIESPPRTHASDLPQMPEAKATPTTETISSTYVRSVNELKLDTGDWYYLDGVNEKGPFTFAYLQMLVSGGTLLKNISVYRKSDNIWVPISDQVPIDQPFSEKDIILDSPCQPHETASAAPRDSEKYNFHALYPQFVGYARGKLHDHVMKAYLSKHFMATIGEVLDPWLNAKNSNNSRDFAGHSISRALSVADNSATSNNMDNGVNMQSEGKLFGSLNTSMNCRHGSTQIFSCPDSERGVNYSKKRRMQATQEVDKEFTVISELEADFIVAKSRGDLDQEVIHRHKENNNAQAKAHGWGMMDIRMLERVLARVLRFLENDLKSIACLAATSKLWNTVIQNLRSRSSRIDFSSLGPECTDIVFQSIMKCYAEAKIKKVTLRGCRNISADKLIHFLRGCSSIVSMDISGCSQFKDVPRMFPNVNWQKSSHLPGPCSSGDQSEEKHCKVKSLKQINDKMYGSFRSSRSLENHTSDDSAGRDIVMPSFEVDQEDPMEIDDFHDDSNVAVSPLPHRPCSVKRIKLNSGGKSAKLQIVDDSLKVEASGKCSTGYSGGVYKNFEKHLAATLEEIKGVNAYDFFKHEILDIENKIKAGTYAADSQGIKFFQNDVYLVCRKAFVRHEKERTREKGSQILYLAGKQIMKVACRHIKNLEKKFEKKSGNIPQKQANGNEMLLRLGKVKSRSNLHPTNSTIKKRNRVGMSADVTRSKRRREMSYTDYSDFVVEDMSDRERRFLRQKKIHWSDSDTETSESSGFLEEEYLDKEDDKNDSEDSDSETNFRLEGEDGGFWEQKCPTNDHGMKMEISAREWGAKMTEASLVPPVTRKYEVIEEYVIVADEAEVRRKMNVCLPNDYQEKVRAAKEKLNSNYAHLEIPELKEYKPRKRLGDEVLEQEVYGIDPYTYNLILDTMPKGLDFSTEEQHSIIENELLRVLNEKVRDYTGTGQTPLDYPLQDVVQSLIGEAEKAGDMRKKTVFHGLSKAMEIRQSTEKYVAYRKGLGVVCNKKGGFDKDDFVVDFLGEVYPTWRWYEKQDGIRSLQKNSNDPAPEFYNIVLERPKGDGAGFDLVIVDAMHKANYASRMCHSCQPNCEAKVTAVDGQYRIGIYTIRPVQYGEELTFDYNSLTESQEEYEESVCLCGSHSCKGSYLSLAGALPYQKVLKERHNFFNRHHMLLEACTSSVTQKDKSDLCSAGVGTCLLSGLPDWVVAYSARVVRFMKDERSWLPDQIFKHITKEKKKAGVELSKLGDMDEAQNQVEGIYTQRLHNLAITLDKTRYIIRKLHQDPTKAPPPLRKLKDTELVLQLWKGEHSLVEELLHCMSPHVDAERLNYLKQQIRMHDPPLSSSCGKGLRESLLWLRDELRSMQSSCTSRHDAAADLIHLYAYTKCFFTSLDYGPFESDPIPISPLDLGPKYANSFGSGFQVYQKKYSKDYAQGQLIYWFQQTNMDPGASLNSARRGCLFLPDVSSCYAKTHKQESSHSYGPKEHSELIRRMEHQPQKPWPKGEFWIFKNRGLFGSPMFDAVMNSSPLDKEMMQWLKSRSVIFNGSWDH